MQPLAILQLLALLAVANGAPVVAKKMLGRHCAWPLDFGAAFLDRRPLLGSSKTIRGLFAAILCTTACAPLVGLDTEIGFLVAWTAMAGDLFSSFVKRRLDLPPSSRALGLDQIPESLIPSLACGYVLSLTALDIALTVAIFFVGEIVLSRLLYEVHLRDEPY
jgi:CDP-archaeol synthase